MAEREEQQRTSQSALVPRSPQRVVQILEALSAAPNGMRVSKLSKQLGAPKTSLLNLLRALEIAGYVESIDGGYRLGTASLQLAATIAGGSPLLRPIRHLLRRLAQDTGETAMIGILTQDQRHSMYLESVESRNALRFAVPIGQPLPLYCSAVGWVFMAFQDRAFTADYLSTAKLKAFTPHTLTSKEQILDAVARVKQSGIAESRNQMTEGILGIAAPVFDRTDQVIAVVLVGAPVERATARRDEIVGLVRQTGAEMSEVLGYSGPYSLGTEQSLTMTGAL